MKERPSLEENDVRSIIRLLGEVSAHPGDHAAKKQHLMGGLCSLIQADSWAWGLSRQMEPGKPTVHINLLHGGFTEETYPMFTQAYAHPEMTAVHAAFGKELSERRCHLTRLRQQIDPSDSYRKTAAGPFWEKADINGVIMSLRPLPAGYFTIVGIYRRFSAPPFSEKENRIAHIALSSVHGLHAQGIPEEYATTLLSLSPRQRMTLDLLIQGYTRTQIASHLEISLHTVNQYVKAVFNHFGVHSQAALISSFQSGDGGDC